MRFFPQLLRSSASILSCVIFPVLVLIQSAYSQSYQPIPPTASLIDGTRAPSEQFPNVTPIYLPDDGLCTGTLISPEYILTAAHCFFGDNNQRAVGNNDVVVVFAGQQFRSSRIFIHPSYRSRSEACVEKELDAALIKIPGINTSVAPAILTRSTPAIGLNMTLVGYGLEGTGSTGEQNRVPENGFVNFGTTPIERVSSSYIQWNFDRGESNTAAGDSGGPSFASVAGQTELIGITCGGGGHSEFGTESLNTRVDKLVDWIDSIAGTSPSPTAPVLLGPSSIQGRKGQSLAVELSFRGSAPAIVEARGLPDGLNISGSTISGIPESAGNYTVEIIASNSIGSSSSNIVISVTEFSPRLYIRNILLQFDSTRDSQDFLIIKGGITLPAGFKPKNKQVQIQIGRFKKSCKLDSSGGCGDLDFFQINGKQKRGAFTKDTLTFELQLINRRLFKALSTLGFPETDFASNGETIQLPVEFLIDGISYSETSNLKFRESDERWARAR